jgi:MFS family permease
MSQMTWRTDPSPRRTLISLWRAIFWVSFPFGILSFVLPIYGKELGASALQVGGLFSAVSLVPIVVRPFLGRALDRWGRRPFLLLGLSGYVVAMVVFCLARTVSALTVARFVQGLGIAFLWLSACTVVADAAAAIGRGRDFGSIDEAASRGVLIGTTVGFSAIFALQGFFDLGWEAVWFWLFAAYTVPALLAFWVAWHGLYTFAYYLGAALGPLAGGWLYDEVGHAVPFILNTAVLLLGALLVAVALREPRAAAAQEVRSPLVGRR